MINETRLRNLFTYLDGLSALTANDYRCNNEIAECIKAIRDELALEKAPKVITPEQLRWLTAETMISVEQAAKMSSTEIDAVAAALAERMAKETGDSQ